jgi:hypothetical protein
MTGDPRVPGYDDATIEQLVHDVAGEWTMPPVRLDAPSWRERVRSPRVRRLAAVGGWFRPLGQAATAAVALTVAAALVAVVLTQPPQPGKSPEPTGSARPGASGAAQSTPMPKIQITGEIPDPAIVVMRSERGDFSRVDLTDGTINGPLTGKSSYSEIRALPDGSMLCLCVAESGSIGGMPTDMSVTLERYDARGKLEGSTTIRQFSGEPDPRDESIFIPERPAHVLVDVGFSDDGRYGFVGWSLRAHPVWHSGVLVVDLSSGQVVGELELPDASDGVDDTRRVVQAPKVVGFIRSGTVLIGRGWYSWSPPASQSPSFTAENDVFTAVFNGGRLTDAHPVPTASDCGPVIVRAGPLAEGAYWLACTDGGPQRTVIRRLGPDGGLLGDVLCLGQLRHRYGPDGGEPGRLQAVRLGSGGGRRDQGHPGVGRPGHRQGHRRGRDPGPLTALGNWLAPAASAKSWLRGALAISPDGTRIYAIGIKEGVDERDMAGSAGVFVFDAATLDPITIWQPTADYISVAVSADGRLVYASGLPGVDAVGRVKLTQQASITVFDTTDGTIRLIAGRLGGDALSFLTPTIK